MTNYRAELQALVDAAASFTEPALGHHKAWAEAVARARVALSVPEPSANTACPITPPPELVEQWRTAPEYTTGMEKLTMVSMTTRRLQEIADQSAQYGADQELNECCKWLPKLPPWSADDLRKHRRRKQPSLKERALQAWVAIEAGTDDQTAMAVIRRALEALPE